MAVIRKKESKEVPAISTSSLPDIIFMLLFFFMLSTSMREQEVLVQFTLPSATEAQKLERKSLTSYIYVGPPARHLRSQFGTAPVIQLNDSFRSVAEIGDYVASERDKIDEAERPGMTIALKADEGTHMGIVTDIKMELRKANALRIVYTTAKEERIDY